MSDFTILNGNSEHHLWTHPCQSWRGRRRCCPCSRHPQHQLFSESRSTFFKNRMDVRIAIHIHIHVITIIYIHVIIDAHTHSTSYLEITWFMRYEQLHLVPKHIHWLITPITINSIWHVIVLVSQWNQLCTNNKITVIIIILIMYIIIYIMLVILIIIIIVII